MLRVPLPMGRAPVKHSLPNLQTYTKKTLRSLRALREEKNPTPKHPNLQTSKHPQNHNF